MNDKLIIGIVTIRTYIYMHAYAAIYAVYAPMYYIPICMYSTVYVDTYIHM